MDKKHLGSIVVGFIIILIGVVLIDTIGDRVDENISPSTHTNESITTSFTSNTVTEEQIAIVAGIGNTVNRSVVNVTFFGNITNQTGPTLNHSAGIDVNWTPIGLIIVNQDTFADGTYNISYIFYTDMTAQTAETDDVTGVTYFGNSDINTLDTGIAIDSEVNWTTAGAISIIATNFTNSSTYDISYNYEGSNYVKNATARVLLPLVIIFFALAVMAAGIVMVFVGIRGMGIL